MERYKNFDIDKLSFKLKDLRGKNSLFQKDIAKEIGITAAYLCNLENIKKTRTIRGIPNSLKDVMKFLAICEALDCSADYILRLNHINIPKGYYEKLQSNSVGNLSNPFHQNMQDYLIGDDLINRIFKNINAIKNLKNMTIFDISREIGRQNILHSSGYNIKNIYNILDKNGFKTRFNTLQILLKLCNIYGCSVEYLFNNVGLDGGNINKDYKLMSYILKEDN